MRNGKARTMVKFLRNEMDTAAKRERRAVQNTDDMDVSDSETIIRSSVC